MGALLGLAGGQPAGGQGDDQQQGGGGWATNVMRWLIMYYGINFVMKQFRGESPQPTPQTNVNGDTIPIPVSQHPHSPLWPANSRYDLRVYLSAEEDLFSIIYRDDADDYLVLRLVNMEYSCNDDAFRDKDMNITVNEPLQQNGSYYAHIVMSRFGYPYDEKDSDYDNTKVVFRTHPLVQYRPRPKKKHKKLLFDDDSDDEEEEDSTELKEGEIIGFWKPELTLRPLCDWTRFKAGTIPEQIVSHYSIDIESNKYWPVLYMDDFWLLGDRLIALNETVDSVPLKISLSPISQWKFMLQTQMQAQYEQQAAWGMSSSEENDEMRRLLMESNPVLLGVTMVVTCLHTVFDFLAFKNDIQFWHKTESVQGLSVRTIFLNAICQLIIFLYLMDQDTTWMILISSGVGFIIECWKITQAAKVTYGFDSYPWIKFEDKETYNLSETKKHDKVAMKYLSYALYPLLFGYTIYSLIYNEHKGWYSFVIGTLVSFIYMFGFIMMCPQLYLNYKMKSTAFLPWRMMTYKFLNTIIDDLFAFLIKMPTMHRLSCFRDDIIFLIFLYQKWIYRTDYSRVNEYGFKKKDEAAIEGTDNSEDAVSADGASSGSQSDEVDPQTKKRQ